METREMYLYDEDISDEPDNVLSNEAALNMLVKIKDVFTELSDYEIAFVRNVGSSLELCRSHCHNFYEPHLTINQSNFLRQLHHRVTCAANAQEVMMPAPSPDKELRDKIKYHAAVVEHLEHLEKFHNLIGLRFHADNGSSPVMDLPLKPSATLGCPSGIPQRRDLGRAQKRHHQRSQQVQREPQVGADEVITPFVGARGREKRCQEASVMSRETYIPCGRPAIMIVDNGDTHPYWMCEHCANHNVKNRGAQAWVPAAPVIALMDQVSEGYEYSSKGEWGTLENMLRFVK